MVTGEYSAEEYIIYHDGQEVYRAGNSNDDSQVYLPANCGVGLKRMRQWCIHTAKMISAEKYTTYGGVKRMFE